MKFPVSDILIEGTRLLNMFIAVITEEVVPASNVLIGKTRTMKQANHIYYRRCIQLPIFVKEEAPLNMLAMLVADDVPIADI